MYLLTDNNHVRAQVNGQYEGWPGKRHQNGQISTSSIHPSIHPSSKTEDVWEGPQKIRILRERKKQHSFANSQWFVHVHGKHCNFSPLSSCRIFFIVSYIQLPPALLSPQAVFRKHTFGVVAFVLPWDDNSDLESFETHSSSSSSSSSSSILTPSKQVLIRMQSLHASNFITGLTRWRASGQSCNNIANNHQSILCISQDLSCISVGACSTWQLASIDKSPLIAEKN